jgi:hypothetical protein
MLARGSMAAAGSWQLAVGKPVAAPPNGVGGATRPSTGGSQTRPLHLPNSLFRIHLPTANSAKKYLTLGEKRLKIPLASLR